MSYEYHFSAEETACLHFANIMSISLKPYILMSKPVAEAIDDEPCDGADKGDDNDGDKG